MSEQQRAALAAHLDALGYPFAARAIREGYDKAEYRTAGCGCDIAVLAPCDDHRAKLKPDQVNA